MSDKLIQEVCNIHMVRTGLEKSWNLTLDWKSHWILCWPGKMAFCLEKSLKIRGSHWKISCTMLKLIWTWKHWWLKVSFCHYIWDQIGETMLSDLLSRATCYIVADSWTTCYIVWIKPNQAVFAGKASRIKAPCHCLWGVLVVQNTISYREKNQINIKQIFLQSTVQICMFGDAVQWPKPIHTIVVAFW